MKETHSIDLNLKRPAHSATAARSTSKGFFWLCFIGLATLPRVLHHLRPWQIRVCAPRSNLREDLLGNRLAAVAERGWWMRTSRHRLRGLRHPPRPRRFGGGPLRGYLLSSGDFVPVTPTRPNDGSVLNIMSE